MTGLSGLEGCKVKVTPIQLLSDHHHTFIMIIASVPSLVISDNRPSTRSALRGLRLLWRSMEQSNEENTVTKGHDWKRIYARTQGGRRILGGRKYLQVLDHCIIPVARWQIILQVKESYF